MRIGVDATSWFNRRGYGRFTRELLPEMVAAGRDHEFVLFADAGQAPSLDLAAGNVRVRPVDCHVAPTAAAAADGYRSPRDMLRFTSAARSERLDAFFFPTVYSYFPLLRARGAVVTIHDTIAERFPELTLPSRRARAFWKMKVWLALRQAKIVLTVSDYSAKDIAARFRVPAERLRVTSEAPSTAYRVDSTGADVAAAARAVGLPEGARWFTYVGGFNPHKRIDVLLRAHALIAASGSGAPHLLLVGTLDADVFHGCRADLVALIERLATKHLIHWTGFVPDENLRALHAGALACVLPSECEGFGLPAVEAAAAGAAVIATIESPLPGLLEGGGWFVRPGDEVALAEAMRRVAADEPERRARAARAKERARALTWRRAAEKALAAIEEAAA
jgi:glycosyltransferase involved in cell wall biosynthesis